MIFNSKLSIVSAILLFATLLINPAFSQNQITGAGATFPAPLYQQWSQLARTQANILVNYQSVGSGAGQNQIISRTVDFGATDAPMAIDRLTSNNLVQVPSVLGAVVVIVNIPGIQTNQLRLSGPTLVKIYRGQIQTWNHPDIVSENPGIALPRLAIAPVYRGDGSGTTFIFTSYLASQSAEWTSSVGVNTSVRWPAGTGARGNEGVSGSVRQIRGAIGYVESAFATTNNIPTVLLRNAANNWVTPTPASFIAASENATWSRNERFIVNLINQPGSNTWPIVSATYIIIPRNGQNRQVVMSWLEWAYFNGQNVATGLGYTPLPPNVAATIVEYMRDELK